MKKPTSFSERGEKPLAPSSHHITFFDLDHTLIDANCSALFGTYLHKNRIIGSLKALSLITIYYLHKYRVLSLSKLHKWSFALLFKGRSKENIDSLINDFVNSDFFIPMYPQMKEHFEKARISGDVYILSASPDFIVEAYAKKFQVDGFLGTEYCVDQKGRFSEVGVIVDGDAKAAFARGMINGRRSAAYTDDMADLPLLEAVDRGFVVRKDSVDEMDGMDGMDKVDKVDKFDARRKSTLD